MHAYCLFCETQKCAFVAQMIERRYGIRSISPVVIQRKWVRGACLEEHHSWLPGYIFLYPDEPIEKRFYMLGIRRWLGRGELQGQDLAFAHMLRERDGVMGTIRLAEVGDRCAVDDSLWRDMEGRVVKIDRGRKRCCVEFTFDSVTRTVWLGYELVRPAEQQEPQEGRSAPHKS